MSAVIVDTTIRRVQNCLIDVDIFKHLQLIIAYYCDYVLYTIGNCLVFYQQEHIKNKGKKEKKNEKDWKRVYNILITAFVIVA